MMRICFLVFLFFTWLACLPKVGHGEVFLVSSAFADESITLSLDEALAIALRDNREVRLSQEKLAQEKSKVAEAKSAFWPEISLNTTATRTRGLYRKDINSYSFSTGIKQYLYKGGKTVNTLHKAEYETRAQEAVVDKATSEIALGVKKLFYTLSIAKELTQLNKEILENTKAYLATITARYEKGEVSESEVLKVKVSVSSYESIYEAALNQMHSAIALLKSALYIEEDAVVDIQNGFEYTPREIAVDEAILNALRLRPEIKQYEAQYEADKAQVEITKSENRPTVYGSFDYYSRSTTSLSFSPSKGWQDYNLVGLTLSWPIFDGWATKHKVEQAVSTLKQDSILQEKLKMDIATQVKEAYLSLKSAIAIIEPKKKDIELYTDNLTVAQAQYQKGILSELGLKDAKLKLSVSQFNQKQALYDCLVAKARLENAMGVR